jgi:ABC-type glutathione transport system ATPase component
VLQAIANQYFTQGIFNGFAIVGIAIIFDRISQAYGQRLQKHRGCPMTKSRTSESRSATSTRSSAADPQAFVEAVKAGMTKAELGKAHGHILGLNNINISMPAGKIQVVMGLSGSGKSTLIRHINRLIDPTAGDHDRRQERAEDDGSRTCASSAATRPRWCSRSFALLPHRTVIDNVTFGLEVRGIDRQKAIDTGMRWIERVGLKGFEKKYPEPAFGRHAAARRPGPRPGQRCLHPA